MTKDIQNNNVTVQINAKDLSGKPLRVHDCDVFVIHFFTDDPKRYLTFSKRDFIVTEFFDEITIPRHQCERLNSGVLQYTIDYLPYNHNCVYEEKGDDCENEFHLHHRHHLHENLIHTRPIVSDIYWRNIHHPHPSFPLNSVTLFDIERLQREIDAERISREKDIQDLQGQFGEGFSDKLDAEIERSKNEDARINATLEALGLTLGELGGNVGSNQDKNQTDITQNKVDIASEIARATAKETELKQAIDGEISRAKAQEEVIATGLQMEKERAVANESNINDRLVSLTDRFESFKELNSETLKSEIERAKSVESSLNEKINNVNSALANEVQRAAEKDIEHTNLVTTESNRAQAVENKIATDLETEKNRAIDAEKHLLDEVHSVQETVSNLATATNVYTKSEVDNKVNQVKNDVNTINNWVNNHNNDVDALNVKVNGIVADVDKAKADLLAEIAKCDAENDKQATELKTLSDNVYNKSEVDTKVNDLNSSIASLENWKNNHVDNTEGLVEKVGNIEKNITKLTTDLSTETTNRINADTTLETKVSVAEGKVDAEVIRSKAQEKLISDELAEVKENAVAKHTELSDSIAETNANLTLEIAERKAQDKVLNDALEIVNGDVETNGSIKKSLADAKAYTDAEIGKAKLANDVSLAHTLVDYATNTEVDKKISDVIGSAPEALDTLGKISSALSQDSDAITAINNVLSGKANSEDVYTKTEIDSVINSVNNALATEVTNRTNADSVIDSKVEDLKTKVDSIETSVNDNNSTLADAISAEETARKSADKTISDKLDSEVEKLNTKVSDLSAKLIEEIAESDAKDVEIDSNISALNTLLSNVETKVDNEVERATNKDNELVAKDTELEAKINANTLAIETEGNRSRQVEKELNDKINSIEIPVVDFTDVNTSISSLNDKIDSEISTARANEKINSDNIALLQTSVNGLTESVNNQSAKDTELEAKIGVNTTAIANEVTRATKAEKDLSDKIDAIVIPDFTEVNNAISTLDNKVDNAVSTLQTNLDNEITTARANEKTNADNISLLQTSVNGINDSIASTNASITQLQADSSAKDSELENSINVEKNRAENAEKALSDKIDVINGDKETVGSIAHAVHDAEHYTDDKLSEYKIEAESKYQPKGDYLTEHQDISNLATKQEVNDTIQKVVGNAPMALDTLEEIANKLSDNDDAVSAIVNTLSEKANSSDVYTKSEVDQAIEDIDVSEQLKDYAKKDECSVIRDENGNKLDLIIDFSDDEPYDENGVPVYNKNEVDALLNDKVSKQELQDAIDSIESGGNNDVDLSNYYDKTYIDGVVSSVNNSLNSKLPIESFNDWSEGVATKEYVDNAISEIEIPDTDLSSYYNKTEVQSLLGERALKAAVISMQNDIDSINETLETKADAVNVYSKSEVNNLINNLIKTYTSDEFEALSEEEKNNGIIIVL